MFGLNQFGSFNRPQDEADSQANAWYAGMPEWSGGGVGPEGSPNPYRNGRTGEVSWFDPAAYSNPALQWNAPVSRDGIEGSTSLGGRTLQSIGGIDPAQFQAFRGDGQYYTTGPNGQEEAVMLQDGSNAIIPKSLAEKYLSPELYRNTRDVKDTASWFEKAMPMAAAALVTYLTGGAGAGVANSLFGSGALASAGSGALAAGVTGQNPIYGAVLGGVKGALPSMGGSPMFQGEGGIPNTPSEPLYNPVSYPTPQDTGYNVNPWEEPVSSGPMNTRYDVNPWEEPVSSGPMNTPQGASGGVKDWLKETNTSLKDTLGMGLGPLVLGGLGLAGGLLGGTSSAQSLAGPAGPTAAQQAYLNRPGVSWDWDAIQAEAAKAGIPVSQLIARGWQNVTGGKYNKPAMAEGGVLNMLARGGGTGRSDSIDARLSDGEYVMDAETVAMLGDGSTQAGAEKLDHMREALRKHKGRAMARGQISPDARSPLEYVKGAA